VRLWPFAAPVMLTSALASCGASLETRSNDFMAKCAPTGFSHGQCAFLFAMSERARDDSDSAQATASMAAGLSTMPRR
jgi:hypothetical protein